MPGIAGVIGSRLGANTEPTIRSMVAAMRHDPSYECGWFNVPETAACAGWVAHPGSFASRMARTSRHGQVTCVLAGELLGAIEDTDPAAAYAEEGDGFVRRLNGFFSGILIDRARSRVLLFNDRYGLERIYWHQAPEGLYFASEAKALLAVVPRLRRLNDQGVAELMAFGCTRGQRTLFDGVGLLEGGSLWSFEQEDSRKTRYMTPACLEQQPVLSTNAFAEEFAATFKRVLPRYVGDGAGVGISLTAGLDTRMIMACLPPTARRPVTYTFGGRQGRTLDERIAADVATHCGLPHQTLNIDGAFLQGFESYVDKTVHVTDGCFGATGAHEVYLNAKARELAPIRLTGNYGSEVLRSMTTFKPLGLSSGMFSDEFARHVTSARPVAGDGTHPVTFAAFQEIPWNLYGSLAAGRSQVTVRTPYMDNEIVALAYRAPAHARQSPASALHLIAENDRRLGRIATDRGIVVGREGPIRRLHQVLAEVTFKLDCLHVDGLPRWLAAFDPALHSLSKVGVLGLHKYLSYRLWFRNEVSQYVMQVLTDPRTARMPYWNREFLTAMATDHVAGRRNYVREINAVLTLESIDRQLIRT